MKELNLNWQTGLPLTFGEREGRKETAIVRASVRMVIFRHHGGDTECLFVSHPVKGYEVPGGALDPDELPMEAALRELAEEAGLVIDSTETLVQLAGFVPITDQQNGRWLDIVYVAQLTDKEVDEATQMAAEFPTIWLNLENIAQHLSVNARKIIDRARRL